MYETKKEKTMRTRFTALLATTAIALAGTAYATDASYNAETNVKQDKRGGYTRESTVESKDASGRVATDVTVEKSVDRDGDVKKTTTVEKVTDPKGLMNKQVDKTKEVDRVKDGKHTREVERTVNGRTVSETRN